MELRAMSNSLFTPSSIAVSIAVCLAWLYLGARNDAREREMMQSERAAALCTPAPGEISHTSYEPNGSMRCAVMRGRQVVTRMEIAK